MIQFPNLSKMLVIWNLTRADGPQLLQRLWDPELKTPLVEIPGLDHCSLWSNDDNVSVFTTEPYGLDYKTLQAWMRLCEEHGLKVDIDARCSCHNPGRTTFAIFTIDHEKMREIASRRIKGFDI